MGIPHLITFLRPYAELESLAGQDLVLDGPAFAYFLYYLCLNRIADARNPFEAGLSYEELGEAVIVWLDGLRQSGAVIKRIYFDGFLPPSKFDTRLKRLAAQTKQLIDYYNAYPIPCRAPSRTRKNNPPSLFSSQATRPAPTILPPPSFLVPAVLETLGRYEYYKAITQVVPGEADLYCARYLKNHGGIVCTGDSDLLVHDLGSSGAVSFFKDIEIDPKGDTGSLHTLVYQPAAIASRLGLPNFHGLRALAFEMFMDSHGTWRKLLMQATTLTAIKANKNMYDDFCKEYNPLEAGVREIGHSATMLSILQFLDPRTSEIVLQFPALAKLAGQDPVIGYPSPSLDTPHVFLPFLLDCAVRTSAWEMSTSVRQLSYGLLNLIAPENQQQSSIYEHRRQQKDSSGRECQLPSLSEIPGACIALVNLLDKLREKLPKASTTDLWIAAAVYQDVEWSSSLGRVVLSRLVTEQLSDLQDQWNPHRNYTWDIIQLIAQIQGSYYSFRILKQITRLLVSHTGSESLPNSIQQLHFRLEPLPAFCDFPGLHDVASVIKTIQRNVMLKVAHGVLGIQEPQPTEVPLKSLRKKRKRKQAQGLIESSTAKTKSSNPFELLQEE